MTFQYPGQVQAFKTNNFPGEKQDIVGGFLQHCPSLRDSNNKGLHVVVWDKTFILSTLGSNLVI